MNFALTQRARSLLLFLSAAGYAAWFSGLGEQTDAQGAGGLNAARGLQVAFAAAPAVAQILRDPFAGEPERAPLPLPATRSSTISLPGVSVPDISIPSPGGASAIAARTAAPLALRATIVGSRSVAYVEYGPALEIVRVGDALGELRIIRIDLRGLTFANGTRLDLPDAFHATPPPAQNVGTALVLQLSHLRRLLGAHSSAPLPAPSVLAQPAATPTSRPPTPGPMPTIDARGLTVGTNPTPDPNGATAYPYPYPYAPPR
jgi:hypothetical protein